MKIWEMTRSFCRKEERCVWGTIGTFCVRQRPAFLRINVTRRWGLGLCVQRSIGAIITMENSEESRQMKGKLYSFSESRE